MYEFAISRGEGTLIDYGTCSEITFNTSAANVDGTPYVNGETVIFAECAFDCATGAKGVPSREHVAHVLEMEAKMVRELG